MGFDAVFFAGFGLAAVVVGAFGTIGTTVSTASVALRRETPVREEEAFVLFTARSAPAGFSFAVRDLGSRLKAMPAVALAAPDDALLRAVLVKLFADRQLAVDEGLIGYVAARIERSFAAARAIVARLDEEAMRQKRPLTRVLAGEIMRSDET